MGLVLLRIGEFEAGPASADHQAHIGGSPGPKRDVKVLVWLRVVLAAPASENLPEDADGMFGQIGLTQELHADVVVPDNVPTMDGELIAEVGPEFRHHHLAAGPWDDRVRFGRQNLVHQGPSVLLLGLEGPTQLGIVHGLPGCFALLERAGLGHRVTEPDTGTGGG